MLRYRILFLITLSIFQAAPASARYPSICHPGLGTGIISRDCATAMSEFFTPIWDHITTTERKKTRPFTSTSDDWLHTIPHGITVGTCALSIDFSGTGRGERVVNTSWNLIFYNIGHVIRTCVDGHGLGGSIVANGLSFKVVQATPLKSYNDLLLSVSSTFDQA